MDVAPGRDRHLTGWLRAIGESRLSQNFQHYHCYHLDIGTWESRLDASGYVPRCFSNDLWVGSSASANIALIPYAHPLPLTPGYGHEAEYHIHGKCRKNSRQTES